MRYYPKSKDDKKEASAMNAKKWQLDLLRLNPSYLSWGPYEDYMGTGEGETGWNARIIKTSWKDFGPWGLDELNELVNFYFEVSRENVNCEDCDGSGHNPKTKEIADAFYGFDNSECRWCDKITQDEVEALQAAGRLRVSGKTGWEKKEGLTAAEVNAANGLGGGMLHNLNHDAINRWILIETRAKRLGVWGKCTKCKGTGYIYTKPEAKVNLILWWLHPRKGCSRGIEIQNIQQAELPEVFALLKEASDRNAKRFAKAVAMAKKNRTKKVVDKSEAN